MLSEASSLKLSTLSRWASLRAKNMKLFESIAADYTDHCATVETPMSFEDFFYQTTFFRGKGNWIVYRNMMKDLGEDPALDSYLTLRREARTD